jgi:hypothetical protein
MNSSNFFTEDKNISSPTSTNYRTQKLSTKKVTKKDAKETNLIIIKEKLKVESLKSKLTDKKQEIERYKQEINRIFKKSNMKETELKKYIAGLNSKIMNIDVKNGDEIDENCNQIMEMIGSIQEKIKIEINYTKQEMEKEVLYRFMEAEHKQQNLLNEKTEEQKRIISKMNFTRLEIEKIRKLFADTNSECENLTKENDNLKMAYQILEDDKRSYSKKLKQLQKECRHLIKENQNLFDEEDIQKLQTINLNDEGDIDSNESQEEDSRGKN